MCVAGGKRCEYSDALSNVRRQARRKHEGKYGNKGSKYHLAREVDKAVNKFLEQNKDLVKAHLPEKMPFNYTPSTTPIPESLTTMLGNPKKDEIVGLEDKQHNIMLKSLHERMQKWEDGLERDEMRAYSGYAMADYVPINAYLRRKGLSKYVKEEYVLDRGESLEDYKERFLKPAVKNLDSALAKAVPAGEPERLYRFYRVPAGVKTADFVKQYMSAGQGFNDGGYMSTSADPEYVLSHIAGKSKGGKGSEYVVFEMLSSSGVSLQPEDERDLNGNGGIQDFEAEVLLPRNKKFRITGSGRRKMSLAKDRTDLETWNKNFNGWNRNGFNFKKGDGLNMTVIQMIDEDLIKETAKKESKAK